MIEVKKEYKKVITQGFTVFIVLVSIALILDISTYYLKIDGGLDMFFISPFHTCELPIFSIIYEKVPYIMFLLTYLLAFTLGGSIPFIVAKKIKERFHLL